MRARRRSTSANVSAWPVLMPSVSSMTRNRATLWRTRTTAAGGKAAMSTPPARRTVESASICRCRNRSAYSCTSALIAGRWLASAPNSVVSVAPAGSLLKSHKARSGSSDASARLALEIAICAAPEQGQEQIVHRAEVVVDELRLEAGSGRHASRRDSGVTVFEHHQLRCIEEGGTRRRVVRTDPAGRGHRLALCHGARRC